MKNESVNFEFLVDQLREITAERNNLRGLTDDVATLRRQVDVLRWVKTKAFDILRKRSETIKEKDGVIESLKHALEVQAENYRRDTEALRQQIPNPNWTSMDRVAKSCQDISTTLEIDRLQSRIRLREQMLERAREVGKTWRRRCQDLYSNIERVRLENERLKLQIERMQKKESFIKSMES